MGVLIFAAIIIIIILIAIIVGKKDKNSFAGSTFIDSPQKQAGRRGEMFARLVIRG